MKTAIADALNEQLNAEFASSHLYLSMSAWFETLALSGFAHWMFVQYKEEMDHTLKFFKYLQDRGARVRLSAIPAPKQDWSTPWEVLEDTLEHERRTTAHINQLMELAISEKDYATQQFLAWYVSEQVEEEAAISRILDRYRTLKDSPHTLIYIDKEMGKRASAG